MGDLLNFNDHIDKTQNKQRYLGYEKGKVLEETIKELIAKIPDIPEETIINYFTKIVKGEILLDPNIALNVLFLVTKIIFILGFGTILMRSSIGRSTSILGIST